MTTNSLANPLGQLSIGKKITVITAGFITAILVIIVYTLLTIEGQRSDAKIIDLAGRQRMLT